MKKKMKMIRISERSYRVLAEVAKREKRTLTAQLEVLLDSVAQQIEASLSEEEREERRKRQDAEREEEFQQKLYDNALQWWDSTPPEKMDFRKNVDKVNLELLYNRAKERTGRKDIAEDMVAQAMMQAVKNAQAAKTKLKAEREAMVAEARAAEEGDDEEDEDWAGW